jgi:hypothetical protein
MNESTMHLITVEVAYALPHEQLIIPLKVHAECTAEEAVKLSGILQKFPDIDANALQLGIFGKLAKNDTALRQMDRVEIYRPLIADPKAVRKQRAADGKIMKKGGGDLPTEGE